MIADDHESIRERVRSLLDRETDIEVIAEAGDTEDARTQSIELRPDVLVLDLNMPGGPSLSSIRPIKERSAGTEVVVFTAQDDRATMEAAFHHGAAGFVAKAEAPERLVAAVHAAATGARA